MIPERPARVHHILIAEPAVKYTLGRGSRPVRWDGVFSLLFQAGWQAENYRRSLSGVTPAVQVSKCRRSHDICPTTRPIASGRTIGVVWAPHPYSTVRIHMRTPLSDDPGRLSVCRMLPGLLLADDPIPDPKRPTKKSLAIPNILSTT